MHCDGYFSVTDVSYDNDDDAYCIDCQDSGYGSFGSDDDDDSDEDYDNETIHDYDSDVFIVLGIDAPNNGLRLYGFEIELNSDYSTRYSTAEAFLARAAGRGIVKHDGSIGDGHTGLELVSVPLSLDDSRFLIGQVFRDDRLSGGYPDESCGMHVHVSRSALTASQIARLVRFLYWPPNYGFVEMIAGRALVNHRHAAIDNRDASWKARFNTTYSGPLRMIDGVRYTALNLSNTETIEFRIFASSTKVARLRANVEACDALLSFCASSERSYADAREPEVFRAYVASRGSDYAHLAALLAPEPTGSTLICAS